MKKGKERIGRSFFSILVKNYLAFTIFNLLVLLILAVVFIWIIVYSLAAPNYISSADKNFLKNAEYRKLNINNIAGKSGGIEILNNENKAIYKSGNMIKGYTYYTKEQLKYIPNYNQNYKIIESYKFNDGKQILILGVDNSYNFQGYVTISGRSKNFVNKIIWYEILNKNLNVILSGGKVPYKKNNYSKKGVKLFIRKPSRWLLC